MRRRPPRSTRTDTLFPYTTLFRSRRVMAQTNWTTLKEARAGGIAVQLRRYNLPSPVEMRVIETQPVVSMMLPPYPVERLGRYEGSGADRSEEHTSELQSLMRISYAVFCLKKKKENESDNATD